MSRPRFVIETVAWFANHRYGDHDGGEIPDDIAQATVVQLVTAGLVGNPAEQRMTRLAFARWTWLVAAVVVAFHLATATIYSYHRDEVYYLASGRRLAWGYVDHPPITPFLYRVSDTRLRFVVVRLADHPRVACTARSSS